MQTQTGTSTTPAPKSKLKVSKKTADAVTGTTDTKAEPKAAKAKTPAKEKTPSKFISKDVILDGRRMRVAEYQDYTFSINDRKDRRLTDAELCKDWQSQFPHAVTYVPNHVTGARRDYNVGVHSKAYPGRKDPQSQAWFIAADGTRTQTAPKAEPKAKAPAKVKATTPAPESKAKGGATVNPKGKAGRKQTAA